MMHLGSPSPQGLAIWLSSMAVASAIIHRVRSTNTTKGHVSCPTLSAMFPRVAHGLFTQEREAWVLRDPNVRYQ